MPLARRVPKRGMPGKRWYRQHRLWPFIQNWAAELGLTGSDAINRATQPGSPRQQHDPERERPDPEAGQ